ncbi:MAG TPA: cytochrome c3 family protein [Candidatus Baltobacteraceae bacterium]|nr:cytochrome c3 family protein [Candidatus Baltobacteraceae bacterium]
MAQIFRPRANSLALFSLFGGTGLLAAIAVVGWASFRSDYVTGVSVPRTQPVPFSHKHHVGDDGIDCRYCHTSVEDSRFAGIPSTKICMNCHTQIWADSPALAPVRESYQTGKSLEWTRVHNLPGYVYFDHSIHIHKGVGCSTCHGRVDQMPLTWRVNTLYMDWCLECHRNPEQYIRPRQDVFKMDYVPPADQVALGRKLVKEYKVQSPRVLTSCSTCHR